MYLYLLFIPTFAFLYRCRGGFLGLGSTQAARLLWWALPVGLWGLSQNLFLAPAMALAAFLGLLIPHATFQANASLRSVLGMAAVGLTRLAIILAPLAWFHHALMLFALVGLLQGGAYLIGWRLLNGVDSGIKTAGFTVLGFPIAAGQFATGGSEWGEALTGAVFGLAFTLVKLAQ